MLTYYDFKAAADKVGFYKPELAAMEESLYKCRPYKFEEKKGDNQND